MVSESFSLALQQRAAREVVSEEMPRRALATRFLLFCEITSALLIVELGLFAHFVAMFVLFVIMPVLPHMVRLYAALCLSYRSTDGSYSLHPQLLFASTLTTPCYSSFGLCRGQKENSVNALTTMVARFAFAAVLVPMVLNACGAKQPQNLYQCECRSTRCKSFTSSGACDERECSLYRLYMFDEIAIYSSFPETQDLCRHFEHLAEDEFREVHLCNAVRLPTMLNRTCEAGYMDALAYYRCTGQNSFYPELCDVKFRGCGIFNEEAYLDILILQLCCLAPLMGLALMVLIHLAWFIVAKQTNQPSLMNVSENSELRLRIRRKACHFEQQLQKEQLEQSIWWGRRILEMNLLYFLFDISSDFFVLWRYFYIGTRSSVIFGYCQLAILLVGFLYQFWGTSFRKLFLATCESWKVGMPCNRLQKVLMREKVFEAPLSLFLQFFSAFYLDGSLLSLFLSMLSSIFGISNGFYISRHLAVQEYDDVDDETVIKSGPVVCVVGAGEARLPPPPGLSGADGKAKLPPPPGIKLPAPPGLNPILPAASNGRKPGQFASATE